MYPEQEMDVVNKAENLSVALLGNRINEGQTLFEYLIEFLLIFASAKNKDGAGRMRFHTSDEIAETKGKYWIEPRIGLRRFVFYPYSKVNSRSDVDTDAYEELLDILEKDSREGINDVKIIQDLLHSYAIVTRSRGWYAQALIPVAPEFLLTDAQGIQRRQRKGRSYYDISEDDDNYEKKLAQIDTDFDFNKHNFLARGGQILYLHLLQAMDQDAALDYACRERLEKLLRKMLDDSGKEIGLLSRFVQGEWEGSRKYQTPLVEMNMGYITDGYQARSAAFLGEIVNFLSCNIHPVARIELLAQGMVLSLLRAINIVAARKVNPVAPEPVWIVDMTGDGPSSNIAKLSTRTFSDSYNSFQIAMTRIYEERENKKGEYAEEIKDGRKQSSEIFKRLAKELYLAVPPRGSSSVRFSLTESLVRYLVLALVKPGEKVMFTTFLNMLYDHFRIVISPEHYLKAIKEGAFDGEQSMASYFKKNELRFQDFMKQCGFLRDLSDATAIVENPYKEVTD